MTYYYNRYKILVYFYDVTRILLHVPVDISLPLFWQLSQIYIHLCGQREQNMKNSYSFLQRHSYIRTKCLSIFTRPTWKNYISPLSRRQTYCLSRILLMILLQILTQSCSGCYLFIFWHILIISAMKVCYYQTVCEVASLPSCDHWFQCQIEFWGHFRVFWHRLIISVMMVCYYQTVCDVASLPSCDHLWGHFRVQV